MVAESLAQESRELQMLKVDAGVQNIRQDKGMTKKAAETTEQFFGGVYVNKGHRLVYRVYDDVVEVYALSSFGHYK